MWVRVNCLGILSIRRIRTIPNYSPEDRRRPQKRFDPVNENIHYPTVMVIGPDGENLGTMSSREANSLAASYNLDLFCVAPNANPPVCKILNYGKYRYEKQKSEKAQKKNSRAASLKEIKLHISIGDHDLKVKAKHAKEFLKDGDKVSVCVQLKGREMAHQDLGEDLMKKFISTVEEEVTIFVEKAPSWEGKNYSAILATRTKK